MTLNRPVLEKDQVQGFSVSESETGGHKVISFKGKSNNRGLVVAEIETAPEGQAVRVQVVLAYRPQAEQNCPFEAVLSLPEHINEIRFGRRGAVIWSRH